MSNLTPEVQNINRLTLAFATAVATNLDDANDNAVVSPYNHLRFLSMIAIGANGDTKKELADILFQVTPDNLDAEIDKIVAVNNAVHDSNNNNVTLKSAAAIWGNAKAASIMQAYADTVRDKFDAEIESLDFAGDNQGSMDTMNKWGHDNTNGLIDEFIADLDPEMLAIVATSLYFKGEWTHKFDKKLTVDKDFTVDAGDVYETPMMSQHFFDEEIEYLNGDDYQAVALTYGENNYEDNKFPSMRIVLIRPTDDDVGAKDWLAEQSQQVNIDWLELYGKYRSANGLVEMPRMDIEQEHDLKQALGADAGLENTMGDSPNLSNIFDDDVTFDFVKENIVFKTDENGSEAASIVSGGIRATSVREPAPNIDFKLNRSFVLAVQDLQTGAVLFAGSVNKPNNDMQPKP